MIRFDSVEVRYGDFVAIPDLNLTINDGEFFTFLGPSGCGKTTALRTMAGLITPSAGTITMDDRDITRAAPDKREIGMVFQNYALFPAMNVADNIEFGLRVRKTPKAQRDADVARVAELVGLTPDHLARNLDELSGGQQQRVAIARALVLQPKTLLLDEPLSNLDAKLRQQMRVSLKALQSEVGITTLYVTHDQDEAMALSDRIAVFHDGRIEQVGTPQEIYDASATEFVCTFVGDASRIGDELRTALEQGGDVAGRGRLLPAGAGAARSYIRPEKIGLVPAEGRLGVQGTVVQHQYHGTHSSYVVETHGSRIATMVTETGSVRPEVGDAVTLWIDPAHVLTYPVVDAEGAR